MWAKRPDFCISADPSKGFGITDLLRTNNLGIIDKAIKSPKLLCNFI
jgi:hypothetical protein